MGLGKLSILLWEENGAGDTPHRKLDSLACDVNSLADPPRSFFLAVRESPVGHAIGSER